MSEQETIQDIGGQEQPVQPEYEEPKTNTQNISAAILFMLSLLLLNEIALQKLNKYKQKYPRCFDYVQATQVTTLIGFFAGFILNLTDIINIREVMKEGFSSFFLIVLLPPILYESAINMEREFFYKNFGSILIFAVFGTLIASLSTAFLMYIVSFGLNIEHLTLTACIAFGALVSATDPVAVLSIFKEFGVDPILFSLIFGESILNDAVSIILFETTVESRENQTDTMMAILKFVYVFLGSILLGVTIGLLCAYILKHREQKRQDVQSLNKESQNTRETTILFVVPYVSYFISEGLGMSGIVSIMFCGISMARYALMNVDPQTRRLNKKLYHTLSYSFENLVFLFIGIGFVSFDLAWKECGFTLIFAMFAVIMLSRYINIGLISFILNKNRKKYKITPTYQFFIWYSGFRGAMAFALSLKATEIFVVGRIGNIMLTIVLCYAMLNEISLRQKI
ncbi:hypothetical protein PPERSA_01950 [Pseudocohnilembus persalinus]|uniref:Sodium/hydrogen exchanger n=1 Tax=Pseudocohnilembus persalinus TaxID=266149 RepID=A0A0V0R3L9_PSEPJ|nr:hypothetical protein PPERSA_01950 [Pseudocohnilembus persalinus]|eukprot:KRX09063.1 hypothetical protein PPERSA_01950 [Pseudocohnilembus persalinus]